MRPTESTSLLSSPRQQPKVKPIAIIDDPQPTPKKRRVRPQPAERIKQAQKKEVMRQIKIVDASQLNTQSHHVRTQKNKQKTSYFPKDDYSILEETLIASIQIDEALENEVNQAITIAYQRQSLRVPMIAFMRCANDIKFIKDFSQLSIEYDIEHTKNPSTISKKQLSLDLLHHEKEYKTIVSVILYLESLNPPLTYIISRYPVSLTPKVPELFIDDDIQTVTTTVTTSTTITTTTTRSSGNNNKVVKQGIITPVPSFMERLYMNCVRVTLAGYYYLIYVDLSLTTPEPL